MTQLTALASYIQQNVDFPRFSRLTQALGHQANGAQLRFLKSLIFEKSIEVYSNKTMIYVGQEGCDFIVPTFNAKVEMKYIEDALFTPSKKTLKETTGSIKLMNSMGTNSHKSLPVNYADYLMFVGRQGAMLFDKQTINQKISNSNIGGDGISVDLPTNLGYPLAGPKEMVLGTQSEVDFLKPLMNFLDSYIDNIK